MSLGEYYQDIFYNINKLPLETKIQILRDAKEVCFHWWVDILDCSKSLSREKIDISFEESLKKCEDDAHFVFIHRRGYESWKKANEIFMGWRLEVGYSTMTSPGYYLWIEVKEDKINDLVQKYELLELK